MTLKHFAEKAARVKAKETPTWVTANNSSMAAYGAIKELRAAKEVFIRRHSRRSEFRRKSDWQISGAELARATEVRLPTLMHNTTYSQNLKEYLASVNENLAAAMIDRVESAEKRRSRGPVMRNKDELVEEVRALQSRVKELEALNAEAQVKEVTKNLTLPILKKLGWI